MKNVSNTTHYFDKKADSASNYTNTLGDCAQDYPRNDEVFDLVVIDAEKQVMMTYC